MADLALAIPTLRQARTPAAEAQAMARLAHDPQINRRMEQFARAVERAPDLKAALRDPRVLGVLLPALGMPDAVGQAGLAMRALTADPKDPKGLLAQLPDRRWKSVAETLNLAARGLDGLRDPALRERLAAGLRRAAWREELDQRAPGIADALAFEERAGRARSAYDVLGDPVMRKVVTTVLGLPPQLALQSVEAQARTLSARFDVAKLQDPKQAARMAERYLLAVGGASLAAGPVALPGVGLPAGGLLV